MSHIDPPFARYELDHETRVFNEDGALIEDAPAPAPVTGASGAEGVSVGGRESARHDEAKFLALGERVRREVEAWPEWKQAAAGGVLSELRAHDRAQARSERS